MKRAFLAIGSWILLAVVAASCGSGGSSLDRSKRIGDLSADEQKQLCDDTAAAQGGYGRSVTCPDGSVQTTDVNQARCLSGTQVVAQSCPALTVGDALSCSESQGTDLCAFPTVAECKAVRDCMAIVLGK